MKQTMHHSLHRTYLLTRFYPAAPPPQETGVTGYHHNIRRRGVSSHTSLRPTYDDAHPHQARSPKKALRLFGGIIGMETWEDNTGQPRRPNWAFSHSVNALCPFPAPLEHRPQLIDRDICGPSPSSTSSILKLTSPGCRRSPTAPRPLHGLDYGQHARRARPSPERT